jgi:hypothetical protein
VTMPSRGIGAVMDSKMPKAKTITRKDDPNKVEMFQAVAIAKTIAAGGEKMRKWGGAPKKKDFANAADRLLKRTKSKDSK